MIVFGIDPGIAIVGYGVIEYTRGRFGVISFGSVTTDAGTPLGERLATIYDDIKSLLDKYTPDVVAIEELFFNNNQKTAIQVAMARGVTLLACEHMQIPWYEYTPLQVKQSVVGFGRAEKKQVISMVRNILKLGNELKLDDTADALAIAICHAHTVKSGLRSFYNLK